MLKKVVVLSIIIILLASVVFVVYRYNDDSIEKDLLAENDEFSTNNSSDSINDNVDKDKDTDTKSNDQKTDVKDSNIDKDNLSNSQYDIEKDITSVDDEVYDNENTNQDENNQPSGIEILDETQLDEPEIENDNVTEDDNTNETSEDEDKSDDIKSDDINDLEVGDYSDASNILLKFYSYSDKPEKYHEAIDLLSEDFTFKLAVLEQFGISELTKNDISSSQLSTFADILRTAKLENIENEALGNEKCTITYYQVVTQEGNSFRLRLEAIIEKSGNDWLISSISDTVTQ